ncbi:MAG TPA: peptidylprolyl isomerase [Terriglobales bacterium]|nr:peptidylprolyl isomerase [Terriglobales bacterium]
MIALLLAAAALPAHSQTTKPQAAGSAPAGRTAPPRRTPAATPRTTRTPAPSPTRRLDGIAAVVNDDVILQSDVEEQLYLFITNNQMNPDSATVDTLRRQILNEMINEKLMETEAKRLGYTVSDADLNRAVEKAISDAKTRFGPDGFKEQLARENMSEEQLRAKYRDDLRKQGMVAQLRQKMFPAKPVSQAEAEAFFKAHPEKFPKAPAQVRLSVIQIPVMPDSAADAAGRAKALAIRKRILAGEKFAKLAAEVSDDPGSAKSGGDLGYFAKGTMEPAVEQAAFSLKLGELSEPVQSPYGWHLIEVLDRDTLRTAAGKDSLDAQGQPIPEAHARHILIRVPTTDEDRARAKARAERVAAEARRGTDFTTLVHRYSKLSGPAGTDGDIGLVALNTLYPNIRAGIDTLEVGQTSDVLENQAGYNIFKVTDRKPERPYTLAEVKDDLPKAVAQIKEQERYDEWIQGLRAKAQIEIRRI